MTALPAPTASRSVSPTAAVRWFGGNMPVARLGLIINLLIPMALLIWDARAHRLGANPVGFAIHTTGLVALICLLLSLLVTPLRTITGWSSLVQFRRSLGVYAFYYGCAHLAIYFWWDRQGSVSATFHEITHRYYLAVGFTSLSLMAPLWATSFNRAIRAMGGTWWRRLHKLTYIAAGLGCFHFYLQTKADKRLPNAFIAALAVLLLWRITRAILKEVRAQPKAIAPAATGKARFWKGELRVVGMFHETPSVRTFRLCPADGGPIPFTFQAGQFLNLSVQIDGKKVGRSYTIASPPGRDSYIELTVKREEQGSVSKFLHDMLMTGHTVYASAATGRFTFDPSRGDSGILLVAGGVGITPVMSILRDLTDRCWGGKIDLVFSVRTPADVIFAEELRFLTSRHPNLHVHLTATRDVPDDWQGARGRITAELLRRVVPDLATRPAFVCGPDAMAVFTRNELIAAGVPAERVTVESFTPAAAVAKDPGATPAFGRVGPAVTVTFAKSGQRADLTADQTILDAAESAGVSIDYQCRSGICGTCRTKVTSGQVTMDLRDGLTDGDEAEGYVLACQAHAREDVTVDA